MAVILEIAMELPLNPLTLPTSEAFMDNGDSPVVRDGVSKGSSIAISKITAIDCILCVPDLPHSRHKVCLTLSIRTIYSECNFTKGTSILTGLNPQLSDSSP